MKIMCLTHGLLDSKMYIQVVGFTNILNQSNVQTLIRLESLFSHFVFAALL